MTNPYHTKPPIEHIGWFERLKSRLRGWWLHAYDDSGVNTYLYSNNRCGLCGNATEGNRCHRCHVSWTLS